MSDLQDLIATNAVRAYNQGVERGATEERERIVKLLDECLDWSYDIGIADKESGCQVDVEQLIYLIKGEQK